jgi:hypothetical protein
MISTSKNFSGSAFVSFVNKEVKAKILKLANTD